MGQNSRYQGKIETLHSVDGIQPDEFFNLFVSKRKPVHIKETLPPEEWSGGRWKDLDYLTSKIGNCYFRIEQKDPNLNVFGRSIPRLRMKFSDFVKKLETDDSFYLNTQYNDVGSDSDIEIVKSEEHKKNEEIQEDRKAIHALDIINPSLFLLSNDFTLKPRLMGNLVLQQINLWIGNSPSGTSSGLHHDMHDNLYIVIDGKKQFILIPPQQADIIPLNGQFKNIYPNGLITYYDDVRSDGLTKKEALKLRISALERKIQNLCQSKAKDNIIEAAEQELENVLSEIMDVADEDDFSDGEYLKENESPHSPSFVETERFGGNNTKKLNEKCAISKPVIKEIDQSTDYQASSDFYYPVDDKSPPFFSRLKHSVMLKYKKKEISLPELEGCTPIVVELNPGEMLYLPASWFHEVISSSDSGKFHIAFNYWFHPPNDLSDYSLPYTDKVAWTEKRNSVYRSLEELSRLMTKKSNTLRDDAASAKKSKIFT